MPRVTLEFPARRVRELVFQLPPGEFLKLTEEMQNHAETLEMMRLAEKSFAEWDKEGEDIYDAEPEAR